jgi:1-acyl-sn-glycerol-3-phosphate acyltransferase
MFPEGRINRTKSPLLTIRPGAAIVAQRADVPLVPIWIEGAPAGWAVYSALFIPARVRIIVGTPECFAGNTQEKDATANTDKEGGENGNATFDRTQSRSDAVAWLSQVMGKSLKMGGHSPDDVGFAGKKWFEL